MINGLLQRVITRLSSRIKPHVRERLDMVCRKNINEFGVDPFGFDPEMLKAMAPFAAWFYYNYFRCEAFGLENIPEGRMIAIANHSGQLPFDGMMIETMFLLEAKKPRILRAMAERWSAEIPFVSPFFARGGTIVGDPNACAQLLNMDEGVLVFPEGVKAIAKLFSQRYQLFNFGRGFMRLALQTNSPIVPIAVIGAEEQAPSIANLMPIAKMLGMPALPLIFPQIIPIPLPVKYRIIVGEPMYFKGDGTEDGEVITEYVEQTKRRIQLMINEARSNRKSIFF